MRRTNQRFNTRVKVREGMEERVLYLEKTNYILMQHTVVQGRINKELVGKHASVHKRLGTISQKLKDITDGTALKNTDSYDLVRSVADDLQNLANKVDVMEEVLEEIA